MDSREECCVVELVVVAASTADLWNARRMSRPAGFWERGTFKNSYAFRGFLSASSREIGNRVFLTLNVIGVAATVLQNDYKRNNNHENKSCTQ